MHLWRGNHEPCIDDEYEDQESSQSHGLGNASRHCCQSTEHGGHDHSRHEAEEKEDKKLGCSIALSNMSELKQVNRRWRIVAHQTSKKIDCYIEQYCRSELDGQIGHDPPKGLCKRVDKRIGSLLLYYRTLIIERIDFRHADQGIESIRYSQSAECLSSQILIWTPSSLQGSKKEE